MRSLLVLAIALQVSLGGLCLMMITPQVSAHDAAMPHASMMDGEHAKDAYDCQGEHCPAFALDDDRGFLSSDFFGPELEYGPSTPSLSSDSESVIVQIPRDLHPPGGHLRRMLASVVLRN